MGKVLSVAVGKAKRFNVESRAHKVISQDKPTMAPKFESNMKDLERVLKDHPEIIEQSERKDSFLDDRLKQVYVTSSESVDQRRKINPDKPLPTIRTPVSDFEYGFKMPEYAQIPRGKCTLSQALKFIADHREDPDLWTMAKIAEELELKEQNVINILEHFRALTIHIPDKEGRTKKVLADGKKKDLEFLGMIEEESKKQKSKN